MVARWLNGVVTLALSALLRDARMAFERSPTLHFFFFDKSMGRANQISMSPGLVVVLLPEPKMY